MSADFPPDNSGRSVYLTLPPLSILKYNPWANPGVVSAPIREPSIAQPFNIPPNIYAGALNVTWPIVIASCYAITVTIFNRKNAERDYKPWSFSKSAAFYFFIIAHNAFLALYSAWTFAGMIRAVGNFWPGWKNEHGPAGVADALCKMHGPRGAGSAAIYNMSTETWGISDITMHLEGGNPDSTDVGRIWNEGLAYYGWIFYLSKFYEVVDTFIILAKGKKTSFLQTFHHAGAMFAMWAGIRYMSPPIWMFTCVNSLIHTFMYTYYTTAALGYRIPFSLKRGLTAAQIFQIIFGASYAFLHLFIAYDVPSYVSYSVFDNLSTALPTAASTASSLFSSATGPADFGALLKKAALRAAGEEGLAANVRNYKGETFGMDAIHAAKAQKALQEVVYKQHITRAHCLDTSGQAFAILFNIAYLAPLAALFISFFSNYIKQSNKDQKPADSLKAAADRSSSDVKTQIAEAMSDPQGGNAEPPEDLKGQLNDAKDSVRDASNDIKEKARQASDSISDSKYDSLSNFGKKAQDAAKSVKDRVPSVPEKAQERAQDASDAVKNAAANASDKASSYASAAKGDANDKAEKTEDAASDAANTNTDNKEPKEEPDVKDEDVKKEADDEDVKAGPNTLEEEEEEKADSE